MTPFLHFISFSIIDVPLPRGKYSEGLGAGSPDSHDDHRGALDCQRKGLDSMLALTLEQ